MAKKSKLKRDWPERLRVALVIETSTNYGRQLLSGIVRFRRTSRDWSVFLEQRDLDAAIPPWLPTWRGDGIISRATTDELTDAVALTGVPLIDLTDRRKVLGFTYIWSDDTAIGAAGANHFVERGFRNFAFCGFSNEAWSSRREFAFNQSLRGGEFQVCESFTSTWYGDDADAWETQQSHLVEWLLSLPKPIGIMACNDVRGQHLIDACFQARLLVPEIVAVLGVDDDSLVCQLCDPSLSSIVPNAEQIGFLSAQLLADEMAGRKPAAREHLVPPLGITERQSTDTYAVEDPDVAKALSFIRARACYGIGVEDVSRHVGVSRSTLERKIRKYSEFSPQTHIRNKQIQHVQNLLLNTELTTEQIALNCGFEHPEYLHVVFRRKLGMTPGEFRRAAQH